MSDLGNNPNMHKQPNGNDCFVCGRNNPHGLYMTFYDNGEDEVHCQYTVAEAYNGYPGVVHGGIVATMLDEVIGRVAMIGDHHHFMMTVRLQVKYRHPVPTDTPLHIVGRIVRLRGRIGKAVGEIRTGDGTVLAEAELILADMPAEMLVDVDLKRLGWRVDE